MTQDRPRVELVRRSFFSRLGAAAAAFGAGALVTSASTARAADGFEPARHPQDDWLDQVPGRHRYFFDSISTDAIGDALFYINNYYDVSKEPYGLEPNQLAVVLCFRHGSTPFGYNDAMWAKYGAGLAAMAELKDAEPPKVNPLNSPELSKKFRSHGFTLDAATKLGVRFAICSHASRGLSGIIARRVGGDPAAIYKDLVANAVGTHQIVPAGIVTKNHAQERGYTLA